MNQKNESKSFNFNDHVSTVAKIEDKLHNILHLRHRYITKQLTVL